MPRFNNALSQTLLYGVSIAVMKGISILMLPFIAHRLTLEAFGRLEVLSSFAMVVSILVGLGLENALFRFAGQADDDDERRRIAARIFGLGIVTGLLALALVWFGATLITGQLPGALGVYEIRLVMIMLALESVIAVPMGWLRMQNRALMFFSLSIARAGLQAALILVLLAPGDDITPVLEAGVIATVLQAAVLGFLQYRDTGIALRIRGNAELIVYCLPIVASGLVAFVLNGLDRWIIAGHSGLGDVAEYGVATKFALASVLLLQPFGMWWSPRRFQVLAGPGGNDAAVRAISLGISLCLIIAVAVATGAPVLIDWLMPADYVMAASYALGLVAVMALRELTELINIGCFTRSSTWTQLWINVAATLAGLAAMLGGVNAYGVWGVILALGLAQGLRLVLFFIASQHYHRLAYPQRAIALLGIEALAWIAGTAQIDSTWQHLGYAVIAGLAMVGSALALRLLPLPESMLAGLASRAEAR